MELNEFLGRILFLIGETEITIGKVLLFILIAFVLSVLYRFASLKWLPSFFAKGELDGTGRKRINRLLNLAFIFLLLIAIPLSFGLDYVLYDAQNIEVKVSTILQLLFVILLARLADRVISRKLNNYYHRREEAKTSESRPQKVTRKSADRIAQSLVYVLLILYILKFIDINYTLFDYTVKRELYEFKLSNIFSIILVFLLARLITWALTQLFLFTYYKRKKINPGSQFAINQLLKYFIFTIALLIAIESLGIRLTLVWGGAAALLVGVGLGLQQTFNDLVSGIILLFERTIEVGDVVQVDDLNGTVRKIGLRTSLVETRDNITVIVPNSRLIVEKVINWSHYDNKARFSVSVGVAYGTDTTMIKELLLGVAKENSKVLKRPAPFVRFSEFGESGLLFDLFFFTKEFITYDDVKSDLRFEIDRVFRENNVVIPFPQRDIWMRK